MLAKGARSLLLMWEACVDFLASGFILTDLANMSICGVKQWMGVLSLEF